MFAVFRWNSGYLSFVLLTLDNRISYDPGAACHFETRKCKRKRKIRKSVSFQSIAYYAENDCINAYHVNAYRKRVLIAGQHMSKKLSSFMYLLLRKNVTSKCRTLFKLQEKLSSNLSSAISKYWRDLKKN